MLPLRKDIRYVEADGKLTQAGVEAIQGQIDAGSTTAAGLNTRLTAVETELAGSLINLQTAQTASSNTEFDFTGIPTWVNRVTVIGRGISTNGTSNYTLRIGDGAIVTTGYLGATTTIAGATPTTANPTTGVTLNQSTTAASVFGFEATISRLSGNSWQISGLGSLSNTNTLSMFASGLTLSGALDRVRLTTVAGTDTFDAGDINISWE